MLGTEAEAHDYLNIFYLMNNKMLLLAGRSAVLVCACEREGEKLCVFARDHTKCLCVACAYLRPGVYACTCVCVCVCTCMLISLSVLPCVCLVHI